jgi:hypothetical protein
MTSDKIQDTVTINLAKAPSAPLAGCSATFKLIAGYAFDLTPPVGAKCPSNAIPYRIRGRTFCNFCGVGEYKNAKGACVPCPAGTYQDAVGSIRCKKCPAGFVCSDPVGTSQPDVCEPGSSSPKAGASECKKCPANTYSTYPLPATCTKCPPKTASVEGSSVCGVPWDK